MYRKILHAWMFLSTGGAYEQRLLNTETIHRRRRRLVPSYFKLMFWNNFSSYISQKRFRFTYFSSLIEIQILFFNPSLFLVHLMLAEQSPCRVGIYYFNAVPHILFLFFFVGNIFSENYTLVINEPNFEHLNRN